MSFFTRFQITDESEKARAVKRLVTGSTPDFDFFFMVVLAVLMATLGLVVDSAAVVIGSMLIAPILYPVISLAMGLAMSDYPLMYRSGYTLLKSFAVGVVLSFVAALLFAAGDLEMTEEILSRTKPSLVYFMIAVISGFAVAYSLFRPDLNESFPGVVVSVALLPPMAVIGIGLAMFDRDVIVGALSLFAINVLGILFASLITFSLIDLTQKKKVVNSEIKK